MKKIIILATFIIASSVAFGQVAFHETQTKPLNKQAKKEFRKARIKSIANRLVTPIIICFVVGATVVAPEVEHLMRRK